MRPSSTTQFKLIFILLELAIKDPPFQALWRHIQNYNPTYNIHIRISRSISRELIRSKIAAALILLALQANATWSIIKAIKGLTTKQSIKPTWQLKTKRLSSTASWATRASVPSLLKLKFDNLILDRRKFRMAKKYFVRMDLSPINQLPNRFWFGGSAIPFFIIPVRSCFCIQFVGSKSQCIWSSLFWWVREEEFVVSGGIEKLEFFTIRFWAKFQQAVFPTLASNDFCYQT